MAQYGFMVQGTVGDGNSLFRAVSLQLYGSEDHHDLLRELALCHMVRIVVFCVSSAVIYVSCVRRPLSMSSTLHLSSLIPPVLKATWPLWVALVAGEATLSCR